MVSRDRRELMVWGILERRHSALGCFSAMHPDFALEEKKKNMCGDNRWESFVIFVFWTL